MLTAKIAQERLSRLANNKKSVEILQSFFKTGKGEYAEGDIFIGVKVPDNRKLAKEFIALSLPEISLLFKSKIHEERLLALLILIEQFKKAEETQREKIFRFYFKHLKFVNNWDLVDTSAHTIVGAYLADKNRLVLYELVQSPLLWSRRIAVISCWHFIRQNDFKEILKFAAQLLEDKEDLMHKAVGWMLREVGKKDENVLRHFLNRHAVKMPRTMLRYSIEKFSPLERTKYLKLK